MEPEIKHVHVHSYYSAQKQEFEVSISGLVAVGSETYHVQGRATAADRIMAVDLAYERFVQNMSDRERKEEKMQQRVKALGVLLHEVASLKERGCL